MQRTLILAVPLLIGGCTVMPSDAPSLLPRAIEARSDAEVARAVPDAVPDPAFDTRMAAAIAGFRTASTDFAATLRQAEPRITRSASAASGSDAWIDAQAAIGELGGARGTSDGALADLERLAIERGAAGQPPLPALDAAIAAANAEIGRQNETVERLTAVPKPL